MNNLSVTERLSQTNQSSEYKYQDYRQTAAVVIQPNMGGVFRGQRIWMVYLHLIFFFHYIPDYHDCHNLLKKINSIKMFYFLFYFHEACGMWLSLFNETFVDKITLPVNLRKILLPRNSNDVCKEFEYFFNVMHFSIFQ